jgi:hypothetical protein
MSHNLSLAINVINMRPTKTSEMELHQQQKGVPIIHSYAYVKI